jgi:hypothetical protein
MTSSGGIVQPHMVARIAGLIEDEIGAGTFEPPVDPGTLAYAIVRLAEAFLYNEASASIRGDVDRLREVEAALLGLRRTFVRKSRIRSRGFWTRADPKARRLRGRGGCDFTSSL